MMPRSRAGICALVLAGVGFIVIWLTRPVTTPNPVTPANVLTSSIDLGDNWPDSLQLDAGTILVNEPNQKLSATVRLRNPLETTQEVAILGKTCGCITTIVPPPLAPLATDNLIIETVLPMVTTRKLLAVDIGADSNKSKRTCIRWIINTKARIALASPSTLEAQVGPDGTSNITLNVVTHRWKHESETALQISSPSFAEITAANSETSRHRDGDLRETCWKCELCIKRPSRPPESRFQIREQIPIAITDGVATIQSSVVIADRPAFRQVPESVLLQIAEGLATNRTISVQLADSIKRVEATTDSTFVRIISQDFDPESHLLQIQLAAVPENSPTGIGRSTVRVTPDGDPTQRCDFAVLVWRTGGSAKPVEPGEGRAR